MSFARLMRVSNVFTAMADVWAGFFLVHVDLVEVYDVGRLPALLLASACIYSAGMVFNDVFDVERDREIHPTRPLPSGEVSVRSAVIFGAMLHAVGLASAATAGLFPALTAAAVIGLTFAYNARLKRYRITGSATMGACRFGNMLLGMSVSLLILPPRLLIFPGFLAVYVVVVTLISTLEESEHPRGPFTALLALELGVIGALGAYLYCRSVAGADADELATLAAKVLGALALWILITAIGAWRRPNRSSIGQVVRVSLMGIIVFDAAMLIGTGQLHWARLLVLFLVPYLLGRMLPRPRPAGGRAGPSHENRSEYSSHNGDVLQ